jgi:phosphatidylserine/phosphatidylglycerophosphate/cardiolipin synthase-like enzyme
VFLFDNHFHVERLAMFGDRPKAHLDKSENVVKRKKLTNALVNVSHWASGKSTLFIKNLQGIYHIRCRTEQQAKQFELSLKTMMRNTLWCSQNLYDSFAPVRKNMAATWFVDGRDYFWDVSVALDNAKETIYIHDWWLVNIKKAGEMYNLY